MDDSALLVCDSPKGVDFYREFLLQNGIREVIVTASGEEARQHYIERSFDVCVINAPLRHESGEELAMDIAEKNSSQVILFVKAEIMEAVTERVEDFGVITVSKPISRQLFWSALKLAKVAQRRIEMASNENKKLLKKMEDLKLVTRAKLTLMQYLNLTEPEAHRYIEKQAMDERISRVEVARDILDTYYEG